MTIERIEATYRVVTPLFSTGADPEQAAVRIPSFKGVLRWWWRALAWPRLGGKLDAIRAEEDALFGSARSGRGKVTMRLVRCNAPPPIRGGEALKDGGGAKPGARYLSYGVIEAPGQGGGRDRSRAFLNAPFTFTVELLARVERDSSRRGSLLDALKAVGLLGGMGAKSRKGYGSLMLESLSIDGSASEQAPTSIDALADAIGQLLAAGRGATELPAYTAISSRTRAVLVSADSRDTTPLGLLDRVGREIMRYRSKGRKSQNGSGHVVLNEKSEGNFLRDHELMREARPQDHPRRIVFGLPHNYREGNVEPEGQDRRASPLLIHMHQCGASPIAVMTFLPARFLPQGPAARVKVNRQLVRIADEDAKLWKPVEDLLDRFLNRDPSTAAKTRKEPFGDAIEVGGPR
ncbi:MAG: type III-B CRISPR module RAMP protein Cmr1 [Labilithrix sp.]|nr:type III-B CRISPR module RAMP protein Cmr1 [Labilithrix sp.]MBX3216453.1 type III-B CRISPR module RAMP protein Cmr1 [Labilithrix sp.]